MVTYFGLFSTGPKCSNPACHAEVTDQEMAAYTVMGNHGPVYRCEDCWAVAQRKKQEQGGGYVDVPNHEPSFSRHGVRDRRVLGGVNRRKGV